MSARRFAEWMWYEQVEPFGELRADYHAAQIVTMVHNVAVASEHQKQVEAFLLKFGSQKSGSQKSEPKRQSVAEQVMILNVMAAAFGG